MTRGWGSAAIEVRGLTKRHGDVPAVEGLRFDAPPATVTCLLGPNGAGKSTTMRIILGLDRPTSGTALVGGRPLAGRAEPLRDVGAHLDAGPLHRSRTGRHHLRVAARTNGIPAARVAEVLEHVGLGAAADRAIAGYSLAMRQRLGIGTALLGDAGVLLLDEPADGLDVDGVAWLRGLLRRLADEGRTVLISSHQPGDVQELADRVVVLRRGRLVADVPTEEVLRGLGHRRVRVRSPRADQLLALLQRHRFSVERTGVQEVEVEGSTAAELGDLAHFFHIPVHHLAELQQPFEDRPLVRTDVPACPTVHRITAARGPGGGG